MKHLFSLLAFLVCLQLTGQTDFTSAKVFIKDNARFWSNPSNFDQLSSGRSGFQFTHKLDSVVTKNNVFATTQKIEMEYNSLGNTTKINQYGPDSLTGILRLEGITTFDYQTPGYPSHILVEGLNNTTQQFDPQLEMNLSYDASNRLDSAVISIDDPLFGGGFGPFIGIKQVYSGDLLIQTRQWLFVALLGGWIPASITDMQYDDNDRLIDKLTSSIDFGTGEIVPSDRTTYSYNAQGLKETETQYGWTDPNWEPTQRINSTYYANGTISDEKRQIYNTTTSTWDDNVWTKYPVENVTDHYPFSSYYWDLATSAWYVTDSTVNLLNPALTWGQVAVPSQLGLLSLLGGEVAGDFFGDPDGSVTDESRYFLSDSLSLDLHFDTEDFYYYSLFEGSQVHTVLPEDISVSPNPSGDHFAIDYDLHQKANYTIVNIAGVTIAKGAMQEGKNNIETSGWAPGIYYITIQLEDGMVYLHKQSIQK